MKYFLIPLFTFLSINYFSQSSTKLGKLLGEKTFYTLDSSTIILGKANDSGQYTLIDFYFAGCKPCNANLPKVEKLKLKFGNKLNIISINPVDNKAKVIAHKEEYNLNFTIIYDKDARASRPYLGLPEFTMGYPFYILINPEGVLIYETMNSIGWNKKISKLIKYFLLNNKKDFENPKGGW